MALRLAVSKPYNGAKGAYALPKQLASLMNSLPLIGQFTAAVIIGPIIEKIGHRWTMAATCCVQIVGPISIKSECSGRPVLELGLLTLAIIVQVTGHHPAPFIVGRFLVYAADALVENRLPDCRHSQRVHVQKDKQLGRQQRHVGRHGHDGHDLFFDIFGRRTLIIIHGRWSQGAFRIAIAALGRINDPNVHQSNGIVAGMQVHTCILHMTLGPPGAYIPAAEIDMEVRER
ncbi:hypothetical protein jhhlp_005451 [Lomentospora prolificans]|uniref:Major facilitator superfamily (MFS) profile domain-containing protein n=1 Tax=Lomentospora prolificans TaxID=41688 RepID=A0A2N3N6V9_9PEZI|nr:hypothetical protein jhhlp_005451 [Lomentospora prolificans]